MSGTVPAGDAVFMAIMGIMVSELDTPTIAHVMPRKFKRWNSFSVTNATQNVAKLTYVRLNRQMPCPPRSTVPVNQGCGWRFFTLRTQFAFGDGGDHTSYVSPKDSLIHRSRKIESH
jgi:hypothetical protein